MGPWRVDSDFSDEPFTSTIKFIPLVERVPELAVEEASFLSVASSCGPLPPRPHLRETDDAQPPQRAQERQSLAEARAVAPAPPGGGA